MRRATIDEVAELLLEALDSEGQGEAPAPASRPAVDRRVRVLAWVEENGDDKTAEEISVGIGEPTSKVLGCLRDARSKAKLFEKAPRGGRWTRTAAGREYSKRALAEVQRFKPSGGGAEE
jgi:hypothetical protein